MSELVFPYPARLRNFIAAELRLLVRTKIESAPFFPSARAVSEMSEDAIPARRYSAETYISVISAHVFLLQKDENN